MEEIDTASTHLELLGCMSQLGRPGVDFEDRLLVHLHWSHWTLASRCLAVGTSWSSHEMRLDAALRVTERPRMRKRSLAEGKES